MSLRIRAATQEDLARLHPLIERAYRGDSARMGWTHEADLLSGTRTDLATLEDILADPTQRMLVAERDGALLGSVVIADRGDALAYLGMLCVEPKLQAGGIAKQLLGAAESMAMERFGAHRIEMTVIENRIELIGYYERRGYVRSGERRDFPVALTPPLFMAVLVKPLSR